MPASSISHGRLLVRYRAVGEAPDVGPSSPAVGTFLLWAKTPATATERSDHVSLARVLRFADPPEGGPLLPCELADQPKPSLPAGCRNDEWRRLRRRLVRSATDARRLPQHRARVERLQPQGGR